MFSLSSLKVFCIFAILETNLILFLRILVSFIFLSMAIFSISTDTLSSCHFYRQCPFSTANHKTSSSLSPPKTAYSTWTRSWTPASSRGGGSTWTAGCPTRFSEVTSYLKLDDGPLVVVTVRVLRRREDRNDLREVPFPVPVLRRPPVVHSVSLVLHLVGPAITSSLPDDAHQVVVRKELRGGLYSVNVRAVPVVVELELSWYASVFCFDRICP